MSSFTNRARAAQLVDFKGLQWDSCKCTDIDLSLDWQGKTFIMVEIKGGGAPLTIGQRIHLQGLVQAIRAGGKHAYAIVARHNTKATEDVIAAACEVSSFYSEENKWEQVDTSHTLGDTLNHLYNEHLERNA